MTSPLIQLNETKKYFSTTLSAQRRLVLDRFLASLRRKEISSRPEERFLAIDGVNLEISRGETVGVIGHNGAGKSTLLKLLAGQLQPDAGKVETTGQITEMFNLTAGFKADFSGRQNIHLGGLVRGLASEYLREVEQAIIDFSELGEKIDRPFGTYSQGMKLRLGFGLAIHSTPDILLIDEVLAVGDLQFRNKCLRQLDAMKSRTATVLVTHSTGQALDFCSRVIVMHQGQVAYDGSPEKAVSIYRSLTEDKEPSLATGPVLESDDLVDVRDMSVNTQPGAGARAVDIELRAVIHAIQPPHSLTASIMVYTEDGTEVFSVGNPDLIKSQKLNAGQDLGIEVKIPSLRLSPGTYKCILSLRDGTALIHRTPMGSFTVDGNHRTKWGVLSPLAEWDAEILESQPL